SRLLHRALVRAPRAEADVTIRDPDAGCHPDARRACMLSAHREEPRTMRRRLAVLVLAVLATALLSAVQPSVTAQAPPARNVILVTLDGARTQEIFGGLDLDVLRSTLREGETPESTRVYREFWAPTPEERRSKLMSFFWGEWMARHGSILWNRAKGSRFGISNPHRFSY